MEKSTSKAEKWASRLRFFRGEYPFGPLRVLTNEEGRFNDKNGEPAYRSPNRVIQYQDGRQHGYDVDIYGSITYYYKGVLVPGSFVLKPEELTVDFIFSMSNTEVRRVGIEIYGYDRLVDEKRLKSKHKDKSTGAELFEFKIADSETMTMVRVLDGTPLYDGTRKVYWLQVPPTMKTCKDAIAWTFYKEAEEYAPEVET